MPLINVSNESTFKNITTQGSSFRIPDIYHTINVGGRILKLRGGISVGATGAAGWRYLYVTPGTLDYTVLTNVPYYIPAYRGWYDSANAPTRRCIAEAYFDGTSFVTTGATNAYIWQKYYPGALIPQRYTVAYPQAVTTSNIKLVEGDVNPIEAVTLQTRNRIFTAKSGLFKDNFFVVSTTAQATEYHGLVSTTHISNGVPIAGASARQFTLSANVATFAAGTHTISRGGDDWLQTNLHNTLKN